jgi:hypothetical protein
MATFSDRNILPSQEKAFLSLRKPKLSLPSLVMMEEMTCVSCQKQWTANCIKASPLSDDKTLT